MEHKLSLDELLDLNAPHTYPATPKGIAAAPRLRDQVVRLAKMGLLDDAKYLELFPASAVPTGGIPSFGEYAQLWLDSREITAGTRLNYKGALNLYWMPHLALSRIDLLTTTLLRRNITATDWTSPGVKRNALVRLSTILKSAVSDGLVAKNPAELLELPRPIRSTWSRPIGSSSTCTRPATGPA